MKSVTTRLTVLAAAMAALSLSLSAQAATVGSSDDTTFYTPPASVPSGNPGTLITYRTTTVKLGTGMVANKAWNVTYTSTDALDAANVVSGTVIVPTAAWSGSGTRPVVMYAVGTHGLAENCAPSRQMGAGTDYEASNINAALKAGYAVLVTDYAGYLNGQVPTYLVGKSQARATLDMFRAAMSVPNVGLSAKTKVGVWGFSQGGQTAAWTAEIQKAYAPEVNMVGVAAGGVPADFTESAYNLDGNVGAAFLASGVLGLQSQYPSQMPIDIIASADGKAQLAKLKTECVFQSLPDLHDKSLSDFTNGGFGLADILPIGGIAAVLNAQNLGTGTISTPMYLFHGQADEFIPLDQAVALKNTYCTKYSSVYFDLYPSEHIVTMTQGAAPSLAWMADRFAGKTAPSTCSNTASAPASTAFPAKGDLAVILNKWNLVASIGLKTLGQTVTLPSASTFSATADVTSTSLSGSMNVPDFKQTISIIGLPIQVGLKVSPVGNVTGSNTLDTAGLLHIKGNAQADITITSVLGLSFGECKTVTPVQFPLTFDGPVGALGSGALTFTGTTTFPQIKGCAISAILSSMMSGAGQTYSFTVTPPAPTKF